MTLYLPLDTSMRFRLSTDLRDRFTASTHDVSSRLRYLMERDLKERGRKRSRSLPVACVN